MLESLVEVLPELLYTAAAGVLTVLGVVTELTGFQNLSGGHQTIGLWMLFVGLVALYAGLSLVREKTLPALRGA